MHVHGNTAIIDRELKKSVCIQTSNSIITSITFDCTQAPDSNYDGTIIPGFVDIHAHGGGGYSFSDPDIDHVITARKTHLNHGTTTQNASLVTESLETLRKQVTKLAPLVRAKIFAGIHLEGPYLSPQQCGAHDPNLLRTPNIDELGALLDESENSITMITLAPELENALEATEFLVARGVTVALGHSQADLVTTQKAIKAGAKLITHYSNGMPKLPQQEGSITNIPSHYPHFPLEIIMDQTHVTNEILNNVLSVPERLILITDSMAAAGADDGEYTIGSLEVIVKDG